jgi:MFS family permease
MLKSDPEKPERDVLGVVALMCLAEALSMTGFAAYPAFLALLRDTWDISNSEAGFISGAYFAGYMTAVPVLSSLTDRYDARRIHVGSCLLAAVSNIAFAFFADGVVSAAAFQALAGAGLGGTYMPGLKALTDRVTGPRQGRFIAFYTSTFGIGTSLSLLLAGWLGRWISWNWAFGLLAAGPAAAALIVFQGLAPLEPARLSGGQGALLDNFRVLRDRSVLAYVLRYAAHCWELFGLRSWMVAFILFGYGLAQTGRPALGATEAAVIINLLGSRPFRQGAVHTGCHGGFREPGLVCRFFSRVALVGHACAAGGLLHRDHVGFRRADRRAGGEHPAPSARGGHGGLFVRRIRGRVFGAAGFRARFGCCRRQERSHGMGVRLRQPGDRMPLCIDRRPAQRPFMMES